jgi:hypothetical protein
MLANYFYTQDPVGKTLFGSSYGVQQAPTTAPVDYSNVLASMQGASDYFK